MRFVGSGTLDKPVQRTLTDDVIRRATVVT